MSLKINDQAPDFTLPSTDGTDFTLSQVVKNEPCIIYFYPKDFTSVCTKEACSFRDNFEAFKTLDIKIFGISKDKINTHLKFKEEHNLPFDLLSDTSGKVTRSYKAMIPVLGIPKRITYLLDAEHKIAAVYQDMFGWEKHIKNMIKEVKSNADKRVKRAH